MKAQTRDETIASGARRRLRLLFVVLFCFLCWAAVTLWNQTTRLHEKTTRLAELQTTLDATKQEHDALKLQVTRLNDPEYIEQVLRKDFQMVRQGETLFITPKSGE